MRCESTANTVNGRQYVTVITGSGGTFGGLLGGKVAKIAKMDYRTMPRRVLTFALDGSAKLPPAPAPAKIVAPNDPEFRADQSIAGRGQMRFYMTGCATCHGMRLDPGGTAPDLRLSPAILDGALFKSIMMDGVLSYRGMPAYPELSEADTEAIRHFLRATAQTLPKAVPAK